MGKILECREICKDYVQGRLVTPVLRNINFSMESGEYVAVMGPSGSGKSTLMNLIGCLDRPTSGEILLDGALLKDCTDDQLADIRLNKIGFVFQNFQLLADQTALQNVELPLIYAKVAGNERRKRAAEALERVGLGDRLRHKPNQLSGGQKQRVAIARAMVNHPELLLADEPTGALDSASGMQIMDLFRQLNQEGVTVLMITHDAHIAEQAGRMVLIRDGRLSEADGESAGTEAGHDGEK